MRLQILAPLTRFVSLGKSLHTPELVSSTLKWGKAPSKVVVEANNIMEAKPVTSISISLKLNMEIV